MLFRVKTPLRPPIKGLKMISGFKICFYWYLSWLSSPLQ